jgi:dGTPase
MSIRQHIEDGEKHSLSPYATLSASSKGREVAEEPHEFRTAFQRDRDRILHTKAFRRLGHKTQVFLAPEHDHYRVRLTHTLEVTQIARTIARALMLNEDLVEAICLGHDLGHTPFGHLGEEALSDFLGREFKHNEQSLRIVDHLEKRESGNGLNLTWEVRDGILNHTWSMPPPSTPEAMVARFADRIAYINHDIDDAIRAGVLTEGDLPESTRSLGASSSQRIDSLVTSMIRASDGAEVAMEDGLMDVLLETRTFLFERVYQRPEVKPEQDRAAALVRGLCEHFAAHPDQIPTESATDDPSQSLVDWVSGMTDRYAIREFDRIVR